jgi:pimeloyl-ACP methyl ester carboxylesterase
VQTASSIFKSPQLEKQYFLVYEAVLAMWHSPIEELTITTQFGSTHINACGDKANPPMLLLPGFGANSTMWYPNIPALSRQFHTYAVDTNGQPGKSLPARTLDTSNSAQWIAEVLDGLGIRKAHLVGVSLGGWLALDFAIQNPQQVNRLVLLDPAASFEKMSFAFLRHSLLPFMIHPTRAGLIRFFQWLNRGYKVDEKWGELMLLGILNTRPQPPIRAFPFSDEDLRKLQIPTMLLIGGKSVIYDPQRVCQRATKLIPHIQAEIIPDASHALIAEKSEIVNDRILQFCQVDL